MRRYLVVANEPLGGERLHEKICQRVRLGPCRFHVLVPASVPNGPPPVACGDALALAQRRLDATLNRLHGMGVLATGEVGDSDPRVAIEDARRRQRFDEVLQVTERDGAPGTSGKVGV